MIERGGRVLWQAQSRIPDQSKDVERPRDIHRRDGSDGNGVEERLRVVVMLTQQNRGPSSSEYLQL